MIGVGCVDITAKEKEYVNRVLESGLITAGPVLDRFESKFAVTHGRKFGLMVNSGTDALRIALAALSEMYAWDGGEVIVPAMTFIATANVVLQNGMTPVFVDVDPATFNVDPAKIRDAITPRTRAIIVVHLFGLPCDMRPIMEIAQEHRLRVIEDSCETMGVTAHGQVVGSFGDVACFSTYAAHIISTGVGGLAITDDMRLDDLMRSFANHGRDPVFLGFRDSRRLNPKSYSTKQTASEIVKRRFRFERLGYSARATQLEAALGLGQLERLTEIVDQRGHNFTFMKSQLAGIPGLRTQAIPNGFEHAGMMFPIVIDDLDRDQVAIAIEQCGVETRPFFNILGQAPYADFADESQFPVAEFLSKQGFYVACHQLLEPSDLWQMVDVIKAVVATGKQVAA